jgi:hypothetical protein
MMEWHARAARAGTCGWQNHGRAGLGRAVQCCHKSRKGQADSASPGRDDGHLHHVQRAMCCQAGERSDGGKEKGLRLSA